MQLEHNINNIVGHEISHGFFVLHIWYYIIITTNYMNGLSWVSLAIGNRQELFLLTHS